MRVLVVEDDAGLSAGLKDALTREGFVVNCVASGGQALTAIRTEPPDLLVLDLGLPDMDGLTVLKALREQGCGIGVLVLTARGGLDEKIRGLDQGADDYLAKPFDVRELTARLRVIERRLSQTVTNALSVGDVTLDTATRLATVAGEPLDLARREYMLLKALMENVGKVMTRQALEQHLYSWGEEVTSNSLEVHVHHLRKKLPQGFIKTLRGVGYTVPAP